MRGLFTYRTIRQKTDGRTTTKAQITVHSVDWKIDTKKNDQDEYV